MFEPVSTFYLDRRVDGEWNIGNVHHPHHTGNFVYANLENTIYWHVNLDNLKLNGCRLDFRIQSKPHLPRTWMLAVVMSWTSSAFTLSDCPARALTFLFFFPGG